MLFLPWQFVEFSLKPFYTGHLMFAANLCSDMELELYLITSSLLGLESLIISLGWLIPKPRPKHYGDTVVMHLRYTFI